MGQDLPGRDEGEDFPETDDIFMQNQGWRIDTEHGLINQGDEVQIKI